MERAYWLYAILLVAACAEGDLPDRVEQRDQGQERDDQARDDSDDQDADERDDDRDSKPRPDAGKPDKGKADAGSDEDKSNDDANAGSSDRGLPCDVLDVIESQCTSCHQDPGKFGAPMPLEQWSDFHDENDDGRPFYEVALARVTGEEKPIMPPPPHVLSDDEKSTLVDWLSDGAPKATERCESEEPNDDEPGEEPVTDVEDLDCDVDMQFLAGHDEPFQVPTTPDYYHCFYFKPDFPEGTTGKGFLPMIDNDQVIHHWLLFVKDDATKKPGTSEPCTGVNPGATLIAGWAPGGEPTTAPENVGIDLPKGPNVIYQLELHYNNTVGPSAMDHSGVRLCATQKPQKDLAAIHYLGSENIFVLPMSEGTAGSTCTPKEKVTLLSVNPHMHKTGSHAKMIINRKDGSKETYHDEPFSFESQVNYRKTAVLEPGDTITSTCTFDNDTSSVKVFQEGTNDEMCYLFTLAYPIGAMDTGSDLLGIGLPGPNRCMR